VFIYIEVFIDDRSVLCDTSYIYPPELIPDGEGVAIVPFGVLEVASRLDGSALLSDRS